MARHEKPTYVVQAMNMLQAYCQHCGGSFHAEETHWCREVKGWVPPIKVVLLEVDEVIERLDNVEYE